MNFVAIDVETANPDLSSICQVGVACFRDGVLSSLWDSLVNPIDYFDPRNVSIHGIDEEKVRSSLTWPAVFAEANRLLQGNIVVSHTPFDRVALTRACEKSNLAVCECHWLDSAKVVRRAWPAFSHSGYSLANVAQHLGISYRPHDALEDARCVGEVILRAITEGGLTLDQWIERVKQPIKLATRNRVQPRDVPLARSAVPIQAPPITRDPNPDGSLFGEVVVFTGALSMPRHEAADAAAAAGCEVAANVSRRTTLLVVGDQDIRKLAGHESSTKYRKAEELMANGQSIRVVGESDFHRILNL